MVRNRRRLHYNHRIVDRCFGATPAASTALPSRRAMLWRLGGGLGGVALAHLLGQQGLLAADATPPHFVPGRPHYPPKVKRIIQLFMNGGVSQCDTFDYKPELTK